MKTKKLIIGGITIGGLAGLGFLAYKLWPFTKKKDQSKQRLLPGNTSTTPKTTSPQLPARTPAIPSPARPRSEAPATKDDFPLKYTSQGNRVKLVQKYLNYKFNAELDVDGVWGGLTQRAIVANGQPHEISEAAFRTLEFAMKRIGLAGYTQPNHII